MKSWHMLKLSEKDCFPFCVFVFLESIGQGVPYRCRHGGRTEAKKKSSSIHTSAPAFNCSSRFQRGADRDGGAGLRSVLPFPNPLLSRDRRASVVTSPQGPSCQSECGTAWVESWRLILDLETPCQQLWLGSSWTGLWVGVPNLLGSPGHGPAGLLSGTLLPQL